MKLWPIIVYILFMACDPPNEQNLSVNVPDTVVLKLGDGHQDGSNILDFQIALVDSETKEPYTRLYSDSSYSASMISRNPNAKFLPYAFSENIQIEYLEEYTIVKTGASNPNWNSSKVKIGYMADTNVNIIYYHHRRRDTHDTTVILEHIERVDSLGYIEYQLHKNPNYSR